MSDTHFGHKNIIKYCNRPFKDLQEMHSKMIENWNNKVGPNDVVFHLGDFAFISDQKKLNDLVHSLNGSIHLIPGNHDDDASMFKHTALNGKVVVHPQLMEAKIQVEDEKLRFVFCHYPMVVWNKSHHGAMHLYGHCHNTLPDNPNSLSIDVGVDCHNYEPIALDDVLVKMYKKSWKPVDHHGTTGR